MKICVIGLDCCAPDVIFNDERLVNIRRLMDLGLYGRLESVVPPITVRAWMCMTTNRDLQSEQSDPERRSAQSGKAPSA